MQQTTNQLEQEVNRNLTQIKSVLDNSMTRDWAIRIEYAIQSSADQVTWMKWHKSFYAIEDSKTVIDELISCCKNNPYCSMKLVCEHYRPDYQFVYYIRQQH